MLSLLEAFSLKALFSEEACFIGSLISGQKPSSDGRCASSSAVDLCQFLHMVYSWLVIAFSRYYCTGFLLLKYMLLLSKP